MRATIGGTIATKKRQHHIKNAKPANNAAVSTSAPKKQLKDYSSRDNEPFDETNCAQPNSSQQCSLQIPSPQHPDSQSV